MSVHRSRKMCRSMECSAATHRFSAVMTGSLHVIAKGNVSAQDYDISHYFTNGVG